MNINRSRIKPAKMAVAADLLRLYDNLLKLKGAKPGQTEIPIHAPLSVADALIFSGELGGEVVKRYRPEDGGAVHSLCAEDARTDSAILPGYGLEVRQSLAIDGAEPEQRLATWEGRLEGPVESTPQQGRLELTAEGVTEGPDLAFTTAGLGVEKPNPAYPLDVGGGGTLNSPAYSIDGEPLADWTVTPGPPDVAGWDGSGLVSGYWESLYHVLEPVAAASTGNLTLAGNQTVDGISLTAGMRALAKNQTDPTQNGPYVVVHPGAWTRATDADTWAKLAGATVLVTAGTVNAGLAYAADIEPIGVLGTDAIPWVQDDRTPLGAPTDFNSDTEIDNSSAAMLNGSGWVLPQREFLDFTYAVGDTASPDVVNIWKGQWWWLVDLTLTPDPADDGKLITCKLKNQAGFTVFTLPAVTAKVSTVGIFTNGVAESVLLACPYEASGDDQLVVVVSGEAGSAGGSVEGTATAVFVRPG